MKLYFKEVLKTSQERIQLNGTELGTNLRQIRREYNTPMTNYISTFITDFTWTFKYSSHNSQFYKC